jgi:hypothetical protein
VERRAPLAVGDAVAIAEGGVAVELGVGGGLRRGDGRLCRFLLLGLGQCESEGHLRKEAGIHFDTEQFTD